MNKIEEIFERAAKPAEYARNYLKYLAEIAAEINENDIGQFVEIILSARDRGSAIYFIGNGGSAATASHFANDIQVGTRTKGKPFRVQSLTDNVAILTAVGNDFGYDAIFVKQLEALLVEGDVVVAISASGNSPNVVQGIQFAKRKKCKTVSLTGFDGGKLREISDHTIHVPSQKGEYGPVEDYHMIFDHIIGSYLMFHCRKHDQGSL
jgi:D-sedoheptulose 7-phosphate isomerase